MDWRAVQCTSMQVEEQQTQSQLRKLSLRQFEAGLGVRVGEREVMVHQVQQTGRFLVQQMGRH